MATFCTVDVHVTATSVSVLAAATSHSDRMSKADRRWRVSFNVLTYNSEKHRDGVKVRSSGVTESLLFSFFIIYLFIYLFFIFFYFFFGGRPSSGRGKRAASQ